MRASISPTPATPRTRRAGATTAQWAAVTGATGRALPTRYDGRTMSIDLPLIPRCLSRTSSRIRGNGTLRCWQTAWQAAPGASDSAAACRGATSTDWSSAQGAQPVWIIARQHPGETMAEWFVEGLLQRLLDPADAVSRELQRMATFYIVPNMNPDGSVLGNLRTNAAGANLNREWLQPSAERSPEVLAVRDALHATGCDAFFDIHGDEVLPYVFIAGCEMLPGFSARQQAEQARVRGRTFARPIRTSRASTVTRPASTRTTCSSSPRNTSVIPSAACH